MLFRSPSTDDQFIGRADYQKSAKHSIYGRYMDIRYQLPNYYDGKNALTTPSVGVDNRGRSFVFGDTYSVSSTIINSFRAVLARGRVVRQQNDKLYSPRDLGVNISEGIPHFTNLSVTNFFTVGNSPSAPFVSNQLQGSDDVDVVLGTHQISFGGTFMYSRLFGNSGLRANGQYTFNATNTGHALGDFLMGQPNTFVQGEIGRAHV